MKPYADTNFFSRLYLHGSESNDIQRLLNEAQSTGATRLPITWLHRIETINAFQLYVFAGKQSGRARVTAEQAAAAHATFQADVKEGTFLWKAQIEMGEMERSFEELALRHSATHGFRTYDLLHVASALLLECNTFWSFDPKAERLAALEGLKLK
jgi:predicted nucleic acid-binding protein